MTLVTADLCPEPTIPNGEVKGEKEPNLFFGEITCNIGYHLVEASKNIKCRHGVWSQEELPVCSAIGGCSSLPNLPNGRNVPIQGSRGSAYRFKCNRGFKRFGELRTHCAGDRWSHTYMPSCAKATCDETGMLDIPYGEGRSLLRGAVYKYRCNHGGEMEGSNTLVCNGDKWNGTVPDCNVEPNEPELEVIVSGSVVTTVKPGDWVLVTCQARGGHPVPDIGINMDGLPSGSKDFENFKNSFTFTASEQNDAKNILCTAVNKVGTSAASTILHVHAPPTNAVISGPEVLYHEDEFTYECAVDGGNPAPEITWTVSDHLGQTKEQKGELIGPGLSRMMLKTGSEERMLIINCLGENTEGRVSHTMHVHAHYIPASVEITGPTTATPGEYAHFTCVTTETFPVPALKWKIEKSGEVDEVIYIDGDVSSQNLEDGGVVAFAKIDILIENGFTNALIQCSAVVEGQGEIKSQKHKMDIISIEEPQDFTESNKIETESEEATSFNQIDEDEILYKQHNEIETVFDVKQSPDYLEENEVPSVQHSNKHKLVKLEKIEEFEEQDRSRKLWIPLKPVEDIEDYQHTFEVEQNGVMGDTEVDEDFLRPSALPLAPMLKQEKEDKTQSVHSPVPVSMLYSTSSKIFTPSILIVMMLTLSKLFH